MKYKILMLATCTLSLAAQDPSELYAKAKEYEAAGDYKNALAAKWLQRRIQRAHRRKFFKFVVNHRKRRVKFRSFGAGENLLKLAA